MRCVTLLALLVSLAFAPSAQAFRGHEHTDLGNDALAMAIGYMEASELAYALRWELGFALAAMHLAAGSDHFISTMGEVERSPTLRFGVTFSVPMTRIPVIQRWTKFRLRKKRDKFLSRFEIPEKHLDSVD